MRKVHIAQSFLQMKMKTLFLLPRQQKKKKKKEATEKEKKCIWYGAAEESESMYICKGEIYFPFSACLIFPFPPSAQGEMNGEKFYVNVILFYLTRKRV